ncbi:MAG TPA: tyrosine--tRNA ligase [Dehalococcoidia bacterium]|nr:tyrosine--tRNA ligase [Dehalococcoidia bacterium]
MWPLESVLKRAVAEIIVERELWELLATGKPLRLKQGFDPTYPDLHLGHAVGLRKLRQLQDHGHEVILIVGDWTAQIGDPSGRSKTRPMLSADDVRRNAETYLRQFFSIVDRSRTQVVWQSEWFGAFNLADVIRLTSKFTVAQLLAREDFANRYAANEPIAITELLYPLLQGYDSVQIQSDVEFGGTDQKFNCLVGRELQGMVGQRPQQVFLVPILTGTDGVQKMSKSLGNFIALEDPPADMYGKVMSLRDDLIGLYFELVTDVPDSELEDIRRALAGGRTNPRDLKMRLAREIVAQFHSPEAARTAEDHFVRVYQRRQDPTEVPEHRVDFNSVARNGRGPDGSIEVSLPDLLLGAGLVKSKNEVRQLIAQRGVEVDAERVDQPNWRIRSGSLIRAGKTRFLRIVDSAGDA